MQSFISSIAKLMKGSGLETYMASAYRGMLFIDRVRQNLYVVGILNGKSWVKAWRPFRRVSAALLKKFLSTGPKK